MPRKPKDYTARDLGMTERQHATVKEAAAETMRRIKAGYRYDVVRREWIKPTKKELQP